MSTPSSALDSSAPQPQRPRLRRLAELGRMLGISLVCLVIGGVLFIAVFAANFDAYGENIPGGLGLLLVADILVGALTNLAAGPMRRAGLWNLLLVIPSVVSGSALPAAAVGLARVGTRRDVRVDIAGMNISGLAALAYSTLESWATGIWSETILIQVLLSVVFAAAALLWGRVRGTRSALVASLRSQAATAQRERAALEREHEALEREHRALVAQAESEQRAAIARDMHDSLSHHLSLIAMHAGALAYRRDMPPEQMREVADTIRGDARAANAELRDVLSALREDSADPLPTPGTIDDLVDAAREEGQDVDLTWDGVTAADLAAAGSATVVTLVRITRELLTNARKHAPGSRLDLRIVRDRDELRMTASNPAPAGNGAVGALGGEGALDAGSECAEGGAVGAGSELGTGLGLTGVRERVRLLGGSFAAGPHDENPDDANPDDANPADETFEVKVSLPWRTR